MQAGFRSANIIHAVVIQIRQKDVNCILMETCSSVLIIMIDRSVRCQHCQIFDALSSILGLSQNILKRDSCTFVFSEAAAIFFEASFLSAALDDSVKRYGIRFS